MKKKIIVICLMFCIITVFIYLNCRGKIYDCGLTKVQIETKQAKTSEETIRQYLYWSNQRSPASKSYISDDVKINIQSIVSNCLANGGEFIGQFGGVILDPKQIILLDNDSEKRLMYLVELEAQSWALPIKDKKDFPVFMYVEESNDETNFQIVEITTGI